MVKNGWTLLCSTPVAEKACRLSKLSCEESPKIPALYNAALSKVFPFIWNPALLASKEVAMYGLFGLAVCDGVITMFVLFRLLILSRGLLADAFVV